VEDPDHGFKGYLPPIDKQTEAGACKIIEQAVYDALAKY